jgi:hypothetical protein
MLHKFLLWKEEHFSHVWPSLFTETIFFFPETVTSCHQINQVCPRHLEATGIRVTGACKEDFSWTPKKSH